MQRVATLLLFIGIVFGLALQEPTQALGSPMKIPAMSQADPSAMPDCMASMTKDAMHKPCKCGLVGCIAMMNSGGSMMLAEGSVPPTVVATREQLEHDAKAAALRGRSTAPEPEPPSILA